MSDGPAAFGFCQDAFSTSHFGAIVVRESLPAAASAEEALRATLIDAREPDARGIWACWSDLADYLVRVEEADGVVAVHFAEGAGFINNITTSSGSILAELCVRKPLYSIPSTDVVELYEDGRPLCFGEVGPEWCAQGGFRMTREDFFARLDDRERDG